MSIAGIENRVSILDSILNSHEDQESSVNLLLNGTVLRKYNSLNIVAITYTVTLQINIDSLCCMYLIDRFSQLLRCEVALHFVNTWDINVLTFDYHWKQLQLPVWIDYQALYLQHFIPIEYKSHIELFKNWSFHEFYRLKALITSEQVITSVVEKKNNLYQQNFEVYAWKPGSRIGDWELGIGDQGWVIPKEGRKIRILTIII